MHTTFIDGAGDIGGWQQSTHSKASARGLEWMHVHGRYKVRALRANRHFRDPIVRAVDRWGEAIGTEMRRHDKTFATVWFHGKAYRLPGLSPDSTVSNATSMWVQRTGVHRRTITVVGSSMDGSGAQHACEWTLWIVPGWVYWSKPIDLASTSISGYSEAVGLNSSGWLIGRMWNTGRHGARTFLWRPGIGMVNLQTLLPSSTAWRVDNVAGINARGQIVGQARPARGHAPSRAVLITPPPSA